jgi:hypothetical protein
MHSYLRPIWHIASLKAEPIGKSRRWQKGAGEVCMDRNKCSQASRFAGLTGDCGKRLKVFHVRIGERLVGRPPWEFSQQFQVLISIPDPKP